jgi:REP element-mobilizing transposase RayT
MPRRARIQCEGLFCHVVVRGVARAPIFADDQDREDLLGRLDRIVPESGARCLAWALIPNHFHLVLATGPTRLSRLMSRIETGYARHFNERHGRVGHLFQNRFLSRPANDDGDLQGLIRYVHRNPVHHGLLPGVDSLATYAWCGHPALLGTAPPRRFHAADVALEAFGPTRASARRSLAAWMKREPEQVAEPDLGEATVGKRLGSASGARVRESAGLPDVVVVDRIATLLARRLGLADEVLRGPSKIAAAVEARAFTAHLANVHAGASNSAIARVLRVSERSAARASLLGARIAATRAAVVEEVLRVLGESPDRRERPRQ